MNSPLYKEALRFSWRLAWRHKLLWPFGLFAAFLGQMGLLDLISTLTYATSNLSAQPFWLRLFLEMGASGRTGADDVAIISGQAWVWFVWIVIALVGLFVVLTFVAVVSQGAIIQAAARASQHRHLPSVGSAWHAGAHHFWRLLGLQIVKKMLLSLIALFVAWTAFNLVIYETHADTLLFFFVFLLSACVGLCVSFLTVYAAGYVMIEEYPFWKAVRAAWRMFTKHWLVSIEVGIILLVCNVLVGFVALAALGIAFVPVMMLWFVAAVVQNSVLFISGLLIGMLAFVVFIIFLGSLFSVFTTSVWTYLFMKMHSVGIRSRILHWLS